MLNYFLKRLFLLAVSLFTVMFCLFLLIDATPNLALERQIYELQFLGAEPRALSPDIVDFYKQQYGADQSFLRRFGLYVKNIFILDLGESSLFNEPVIDLIKERLWWTLSLGFFTLAVCLILSLGLAFLRLNKKAKYFFSILDSFFLSLWAAPVFVIGLILHETLGVLFDSSFFLALACLVLSHISLMVFLNQGGIDEEMSKAYVQTAKAKGLSDSVVLLKHVLKNSSFPWLTYAGSFLTLFVAGSIFVEKIFGIPGLGQLTIQATEFQDLNLLVALVSLQSLFLLFGRFLADLIGAWMNPQIRETLK